MDIICFCAFLYKVGTVLNKPENSRSRKWDLIANKWAASFDVLHFSGIGVKLYILWCCGFLKLAIHIFCIFTFSREKINHPFCYLLWYIKWWGMLKKFFISLIKTLHQYHFNNDNCFILVQLSVLHLLLSVLIPFSSNTAVLCKGRSNGGEHGKSVSSIPSAIREKMGVSIFNNMRHLLKYHLQPFSWEIN